LASYSFAAASLLYSHLFLLLLPLLLSSASTRNGKVNIENGKWELQTMGLLSRDFVFSAPILIQIVKPKV